MSASERAVSAFLVFHLIAIVTTAVARPPEERVRTAITVPHGVLSRGVTPILDAIAAGERRVADWLWQSSGALRVATTTYVNAFGLGQKWGMFSNVPPYAEYLKLTFVIDVDRADDTVGTRAVDQLIYPAGRLDRFRGIEGFRASYRNKAIEQVLVTFAKSALDEWPPRPGSRRFVRSEGAPGDGSLIALAPLVRTYRTQYRQRYLRPGEKIVRTEVWRGQAPARPAGEPGDQNMMRARDAALDHFRDGPVTRPTSYAARPDPGVSLNEADIVWVLYYVEEST